MAIKCVCIRQRLLVNLKRGLSDYNTSFYEPCQCQREKNLRYNAKRLQTLAFEDELDLGTR